MSEKALLQESRRPENVPDVTSSPTSSQSNATVSGHRAYATASVSNVEALTLKRPSLDLSPPGQSSVSSPLVTRQIGLLINYESLDACR